MMTRATGAPVSDTSYPAAREAIAFIDRSDRVRIEFTGAQAAATLNGLLTNDVTKLEPGRGQYAAALTAKGKIIADVRVFARNEGFLVDTSAAAGPGLLAMLKKYVNPRLAKFRDVSAETATIGVFGPRAANVAAGICAIDAATMTATEVFANVTATFRGIACTIARVPDLGVPGFDLFVPADSRVPLLEALGGARAAPLSADAAETLRIEAGRPLWGRDMDADTLAQEAALDTISAISFDKGCYTGQETVARVHFRGHVNRTLRGLRCAAPVPGGAEITGGDGAPVGAVRSTAMSPRLGAIALAYVRREVADGESVTVRWSGGETQATVSPLPFD